ncbi:MAG: DUF1269 domain-containing protein [Candidatus Promineofilum sp.]|nr:DUF1269 domain-containing protein [Promineifilum sp.]
MNHMIVFAMPTLDGAYAMRDALDDLRAFELVNVKDAAVVERLPDGSVRIRQAFDLIGAGALGGVVWGALIGLIFLSPWLGMAVGSIAGALAGKLTDIGIDDDFIHEVGEQVRPGHSAFFLLIDNWEGSKALRLLADFDAEIIRTTMAPDEEVRLQAFFAAANDDSQPSF